MNTLKTTPLAALISVALLAGCSDRRDTETRGTTTGSTSATTGSTSGSTAAGSGTTSADASKTGGSTSSSKSAGTDAGASSGATGAKGGSSSDGTKELAMADKNFVTSAAVGGMFEVEAAKLAAGKASDPAVKAFASMLLSQHTKVNDELKQLAGSRSNVTLPTQLPSDKQAQLKKLQQATGPAFDRQFVQQIGVKDHQDDIRAFEKVSKDSKDPELKAWAGKTLPTLREHLAQAKTLPGGGNSASTTGRASTDDGSATTGGLASNSGGVGGAATTPPPPSLGR